MSLRSISLRIGIPRLEGTIRFFSQMGMQNQLMIEEMDKNVNYLKSFWEGMTQQDFYQKIQEWYKVMETSTRLLNEIEEQLGYIQTRFDEVDIGR